MKLLTLVLSCLAALACGRGPDVMMTSRGELQFSVPDGGAVPELTHGFGDVRSGESAKVSFEVVNVGIDPIDIKVVKVATEDLGAFFVQGNAGSVPPRVKRTFTVTFAPVREGAYTGNLEFETNANTGTARVVLTGNAVR